MNAISLLSTINEFESDLLFSFETIFSNPRASHELTFAIATELVLPWPQRRYIEDDSAENLQIWQHSRRLQHH